MIWSDILMWSVICSSLVGVFLLTNKNRIGWWFTIFNNILWSVMWIAWQTYPMLIISVLYMGLGIRGLIKWNKEEKMKTKSVECYSNEPINKVLTKDCGVDGASLQCNCDPAWRKKYCNPHKSRNNDLAREVGCCNRFWPDGTFFKDQALAKLLKKSVSKLTNHDRYKEAERFAQEAYKKCRKVVVTVKEA